jgi:hypothetical protein
LIDQEATMSKLTRTLILGAALAAMNLAGMTAVAQAQTSDAPAGNQEAPRPPTERQVGESYRNYHEALAARAQTAQDDAVERFRRGERASQEQSTTAEAVEQFRRGERAAQGQSAADATVQRQLARERHSIPGQTPDQPTALAPPEPSAQPNWLLASLGGFAAGLALAGGLAVLAARRVGRRARVGHAA